MGLLSTIGAASARAYGFTRSAIAAAVDAYFNRITLLLPGNGTNGAQNNTFLDSSSNNFTITRNGNTTQGTFTPFSQTGWGNYFATGSLQAGSNAALAPGSGNFTIECWVYPVGNTNYMGIYQNYTDGLNRSTALRISINATDNTSLIVQTQGSAIITAATGSMTANAWNHIALVRNGSGSNNLVLYVNGVSKGTATNTTNFSDGYAQVGNTVYNAANYYWNGYISNFRLTTGAALYTGSFTPSTVPLTTSVSSGTVALLTCQSNRFIDNSSNNFSFTISGTPSVQAFRPFAPTAAYSTTTVGGSGYFDGTGDYLSASNATAFLFGTGDFTAEAFVYPTSFPAEAAIITTATTTDFQGFTLNVGTSGNIIVAVGAGTSWTFTTTSGGTLTIGQWQHIALTRSGNVFRVFVNGVQTYTNTNSVSLTNSNNAINIGGRTVSSQYFNGYISNARILKGTAQYTANFTPPSAPLTAIANTQLLLSATNAGITDATAKNVLETVGNAQISTTQSKWGGSSMYFDGTGDYLFSPVGQNYSFPGDFTIECWINTSTTSTEGGSYRRLFATGPDNAASLQIVFSDGSTASGSISVVTSTFVISGNINAATGNWVHVALCRSGSSMKLFIDGVQSGSTATTSQAFTNGATYGLYVGSSQGGTGRYLGYIDDFRISKYARYTTTFTPPTAAFPLS